MSYCLNPQCFHPYNSGTAQYCQRCGLPLKLNQRYRPLKLIGQGGFGKTYLAVDEHLPSTPDCVIKQFFLPNSTPQQFRKAAQLFTQEAVRLDELGKHPQIPQLLAHFSQNQQLFLVQEYIPGKTLSQELQTQGYFNESQIWQLLKDILPVLQFIHEQRIIHRDIKPDNLMRRDSNSEDKSQVVLIDFGIAKQSPQVTQLQTGTIIGTPEYMAPEQSRGRVFRSSDLYSLGATCLFLMTGKSPFELYDVTRDRWVWRNYLPRDTIISQALTKILNKLIETNLSRRYTSAQQILQEIEAIQSSIIISPKTPVNASSTPIFSQLLNQFFPRSRSSLNDQLNSAREVDYTKLQHLLASRRWKAADQETWVVLSQALGLKNKKYLHYYHLQELPCKDLKTINQLWIKYSQNRFGFSIQSQIYQEVAEDYGQFCVRVGWLTYHTQHPAKSLQYRLSAPVGHLPFRHWIVQSGHWWRHVEVISNRLMECEIF
ncbi:MAG: serine/threonine-protein kinase [Microcoleaceae cyanobacterium]